MGCAIITVNDVDCGIELETIGYSAIVYLADMEVSKLPLISISHSKLGDAKAILPKGRHTNVLDGMIFTVTYP